jgi:hypothetical protein
MDTEEGFLKVSYTCRHWSENEKWSRTYLAVKIMTVIIEYNTYEAAMTRRISVIFWDVCFFPATGHRRRNDDPQQGRQADPRGGAGGGGGGSIHPISNLFS